MYVCGYMHVLQSYETAAAQRLGAYVRLCVLYSMCVCVFKYVMLRSLSAEKGNDRFHCPNLQQQSSFDVWPSHILEPKRHKNRNTGVFKSDLFLLGSVLVRVFCNQRRPEFKMEKNFPSIESGFCGQLGKNWDTSKIRTPT